MALPRPDSGKSWYDWAVNFVRSVSVEFQPLLVTGQAALDTDTSTTVSVAGITKRQKVWLQPRSQTAWDAKPSVSSVTDGSFVIAHTAGVSGRLVDYLIV